MVFFSAKKSFISPHPKGFCKIINDIIQSIEKSKLYNFPLERFTGCGVYLLFYNGLFYNNLLSKDLLDYFLSTPIYIGKAVPTGWRNGRIPKKDVSYNLYRRMSEHIINIKKSNLYIEDFKYKYMILDYGLISPLEAELIKMYKPLWNCILDGFGNHNPGINRVNQLKSSWDILHPGRLWANGMKDNSNIEEIKDNIIRFINER